MCLIIIDGILKDVNVFDTFITGAAEGIKTSFQILPSLIGLMTAVGMFKASGGLDIFSYVIRPFADFIGIPKEIVPLAVLRPISGSGAMVIFQNILQTYGPDSFIGRVAAVLQGSSETTFYTIAVYFGATKVINTRYTLPCSLIADIVGFVMSSLVVAWLMF